MNRLLGLTLGFLVIIAPTLGFPSNDSLKIDCVISNYDQVQAVTSSCTAITIKNLAVPAGKSLELNLKTGAQVTISGVISFGFHEWLGPLMLITGDNVKVTGAGGAYLEGNGKQYWDGQGDNGRTKPKFVKIKTQNAIFNNFDLHNCPRQCFSVDQDAKNTKMIGCDVDVSAGSQNGKNTDGYDISGSIITIQDAVVRNQDDCVVVNQGSNITVSNVTCYGGHGLSISVKTASVNQVIFQNSRVYDSRNGIHVKTSTTGKGLINDVTYKNIELKGISRYGINVQQDYNSGHSTGTPSANIPIKELLLNNVHGSMNGQSDSMSVFVLCAKGGCEKWTWTNVKITNGKQGNSCTNFTPSGFSC